MIMTLDEEFGVKAAPLGGDEFPEREVSDADIRVAVDGNGYDGSKRLEGCLNFRRGHSEKGRQRVHG